MASKSLTEAEKLPKADASTEKSLEKLVEQAKEYQHQSQTNGFRHTNYENSNGKEGQAKKETIVRRTKHQPKEQSLPFIQNRDSIHWDAESDSDEDCSPKNGDFVDVTESSTSAFTVVNKGQFNNHVNGNHLPVSPVSPNSKQSIPNGKVYTPPSPQASETRHKDLQQQFHKLQELQKNHRLTPTNQSMRVSADTTPISTPSPAPLGANKHLVTPALYKGANGNGVKPVIAPKPQLRTAVKLPSSERCQIISDVDYSSSSSESEDERQPIKEAKSTTV